MDCAFGAGYDGAFLEGIGKYGIREASGTCQFHEDRSIPEESNFHGNHPRPFGPAKKASQLPSRGNNADLAGKYRATGLSLGQSVTTTPTARAEAAISLMRGFVDG
jgi:hypothetical protein